MKLKNKTILIISPEGWGKSFVSKHHYAKTLAEMGNRVYFLNPPSQQWAQNSPFENLTILDYKPRFRGLGRLPLFISRILTKWEFKGIEARLKVKFDILWNFDSSRFFNLSSLPKNLIKIQHIVDLTENLYRDLGAQTSDICFATTDSIIQSQAQHNPHTYKIHHGFKHQANEAALIPLDASIKETIKVGYVGNLSIKYLNWELTLQLIQENPDVAFTFIGPMGKSNLSNSMAIDPFLSASMEAPNAYFLGPKPSSDIPGLLQNFDILLVAYKAEEFRAQLASPHKFMEYFSTGKVILATYTDEYKDLRHLLAMVDSSDELLDKFKEVKEQLEHYNSSTQINIRKQFSQDNTYTKQIERIESLINSHVK